MYMYIVPDHILAHIKYMCKALSIVATMGYKSVAVIERCTWLLN